MSYKVISNNKVLKVIDGSPLHQGTFTVPQQNVISILPDGSNIAFTFLGNSNAPVTVNIPEQDVQEINGDDVTGETSTVKCSLIKGSLLVPFAEYKIYACFMTQTSTAAPEAIILENTIGDIVWTRQNTGEYIGTLAGGFVGTNKVVVIFGSHGILQYYAGWKLSDDIIKIQSYTFILDGTAPAALSGSVNALNIDNALGYTFVEIRVYP